MPKSIRVVELEMVAGMPAPTGVWHGASNLLIALIGLLLLTMLLGFGAGLVGRVQAQTPNGALRVSYDSISRLQNTTGLEVQLPGLASANGQATVWIDHSFIEGYQIEAIYPQPQQVQTAGEWTLFTFETVTPGEALAINLRLRPLESGLHRGRIGWGQEPGLNLSQVIIP